MHKYILIYFLLMVVGIIVIPCSFIYFSEIRGSGYNREDNRETSGNPFETSKIHYYPSVLPTKNPTEVPTKAPTPATALPEISQALTGGEIQKEGNNVNVYFHKKKKYKVMDWENYIIGVTAAEMPASFEEEALKAQAVAARTYAYAGYKGAYKLRDGVHPNAAVCTDYAHCQAYVSYKKMLKNCGKETGQKNWDKVSGAVKATRGEVLTYKGKLCKTLFHSCSGGQTEDVSLIWGGGKIPYLSSVISEGEESSPAFSTEIELSRKEITEKLRSYRKDAEKSAGGTDAGGLFSPPVRSSSGRVLTMRIKRHIYKGTVIRAALGLRSTNFTFIPLDNGRIKIAVIGFGHGAGMSQYGANAYANKGYGYVKILKHYYKGTKINRIY